jgi:hypothetical protein
MKSILQTAAVSITSALIGALVVTRVQSSPRQQPQPIDTTAPHTSGPPPEVHFLTTTSDPALAQRLSAVEQELGKRNDSANAPIEEPPISPAEADARAAEHRQQREETFAKEPLDRVWSAGAARSFQSDFGAFEDAAFRVGSVDCRTSTCRVQLTWDSYSAARTQAKKIVQHSYAKNCMREILTPEPDNPDAPYTASVYFDCKTPPGGSNP